ncbi:MAG: insulinase family protein [Gemmatimonadota bacterium]|nr:insulinase family protein [Gemmatimonadota bacterium]
MRRTLVLAALCVATGGLGARVLRAQDAPVDTSTTSFQVGHVRVILRHNGANDVVAANIYLLGGTQELTARTAGVEALMLGASEGGTRRYPRAELRAITARMGATIVVDPSLDWTAFGLRTLRQRFDSSWAVFADRLVEPLLDSADVDRTRRQMIAAARQSEADPDIAVAQLADSLLYAGHPYRIDPGGTPSSLGGLTAADVRRYHDQEVVQTRLLVVVVGNINRSELKRAIGGTLAKLPVGRYTWTPPPDFSPAPERALLMGRPLATNYILGYYAGPRAGTRDYAALRIAAAVLSGRMFAEVRSREHLAYAVEAPFLDHAIAVGGLYVTTTNPNAALVAMAREIDRLKSTLVDPTGLKALVGQFLTDYFLKNETNADQAAFLARAELYTGDYRTAGAFVSTLRAVTPEDIQRVATTYVHDVRFGFVGDTTKAPAILRAGF